MGERATRAWPRAWAMIPLLCLVCVTLWGCQSVSPALVDDSADAQIEQPPAEPAQSEDEGGDEAVPQPSEPEQEKSDEVTQQDDVIDDPEEEAVVAGDLNGDGRIDQEDADIFRAGLNAMEGEEGFNPDLDFDGDGVISQFDYQTWWNLVFGG